MTFRDLWLRKELCHFGRIFSHSIVRERTFAGHWHRTKIALVPIVYVFQSEFGLSTSQAEQMFETFDRDQNGYFSLWEFQQFFVCVGNT